jgi:hypothetical protein
VDHLMNNPVLVLRKKIRATEDELLRIIEKYGRDSLEYQALSGSLERRLNQLNEELASIQVQSIEIRPDGVERLKLILRGEGIGKGTISARVLGPILQEIQHVADNIANAIENDPFAPGKIPYTILENSNLMVTGTFAGSFGVELVAEHGQLSLIDDPLITRTLQKFYDLLNTEIDADKIVDQVNDLGSRTFNHYKKLIMSLDDNRVGLDVDWLSEIHGVKKWSIPSYKVKLLRDVLEMIKEAENEDVTLRGFMTGGNIRRNNFELDVKDSNGIKYIIKGRTKNRLLSEQGIKFGEYVEANLIKTTRSIVSTGKDKVTYYLKDVQVIPYTDEDFSQEI